MKEPSLNIRPARAEDAPALSDVARRAKASWGYPEAWLREWEPQLTFSPDYVQRHPVFVAETEAGIVGVAALEESPPESEITHLWVLPDSQGEGVGRALVSAVAARARECGSASLRIESDPNAVPFYERLGAIAVGEIPAPVCGEDRSLPVLRLVL